MLVLQKVREETNEFSWNSPLSSQGWYWRMESRLLGYHDKCMSTFVVVPCWSPLIYKTPRRLSEKLLSTYLSKKLVITGTIIHRMKNTGVSLVKGLFSRIYIPVPQVGNDNVNDGVVDSLRYLISHENFIKPYSNEHILGVLLTKAFWYACFPSCCCPAIWDYINYVHWCLCYLLLFLCIHKIDYIVCIIVYVCCTHFLELGFFFK